MVQEEFDSLPECACYRCTVYREDPQVYRVQIVTIDLSKEERRELMEVFQEKPYLRIDSSAPYLNLEVTCTEDQAMMIGLENSQLPDYAVFNCIKNIVRSYVLHRRPDCDSNFFGSGREREIQIIKPATHE
jgi:hypothetical protein